MISISLKITFNDNPDKGKRIMKKHHAVFIVIGVLLFIGGCAMEPGIDPKALTSPDEKALYDLMEQRCQALNDKDMKQFQRIYVSDSPELEWIKSTGIPSWKRYGVSYNITSLKRICIIGNVAAATFMLRGTNQYGAVWGGTDEVLYEKQGHQWKIVAAGDR